MKLRDLQESDAPLMLEWMRDKNVVKNLQANFSEKTIEDCQSFIKSARKKDSDRHFAITDETDTYMGTVSLKHIADKKAEFAITIRQCAMGKGYSRYGMSEIIRMGFEELDLDMIYWCVAPENVRAVRFYDKNGYLRVDINRLNIMPENYTFEQMMHYIWYAVNKI